MSSLERLSGRSPEEPPRTDGDDRGRIAKGEPKGENLRDEVDRHVREVEKLTSQFAQTKQRLEQIKQAQGVLDGAQELSDRLRQDLSLDERLAVHEQLSKQFGDAARLAPEDLSKTFKEVQQNQDRKAADLYKQKAQQELGGATELPQEAPTDVAPELGALDQQAEATQDKLNREREKSE